MPVLPGKIHLLAEISFPFGTVLILGRSAETDEVVCLEAQLIQYEGQKGKAFQKVQFWAKGNDPFES